ncbi:unnamed protein product [Candida verbasci]|uniref:Complex 1 LYR protein domain-containing protein n=1 Tax=Candida verbasci TaxID=1227364 RepID=A0A9W4TYW0_9ASCO|nr:unnamed protein product [Candida verbasci]
MAKRSGLQREVLKLYRMSIRCIKTKPPQTREHWRSFIHEEFGKYKGIPKIQFNTIEHLIRTGYKRYEMFSNPQIKDIH